jgi:hypothetical protein
MTNAADILEQLGRTAREAWPVAMLWHGVLAAGLVAVLFGARPRLRVATAALAAPLASVSIVSFRFGNPVNGIVFAALSLSTLALSLRCAASPVHPPARGAMVVGAFAFVFGGVYPHFLDGFPRTAYLYAAPVGVVPCATLSAVVGLALLVAAGAPRAYKIVLAAAGLFYGLVGVIWLGVAIDAVLILASVALAIVALGEAGESRASSNVAAHQAEGA